MIEVLPKKEKIDEKRITPTSATVFSPCRSNFILAEASVSPAITRIKPAADECEAELIGRKKIVTTALRVQ